MTSSIMSKRKHTGASGPSNPKRRRADASRSSDLPILPGDVSSIVSKASDIFVHNSPCTYELLFPEGFRFTTRCLANTLGGRYSSTTFAVPAKFQISTPKCTVMIFSTGRSVVVGAKLLDYAALAVRKLALMISEKLDTRVRVVNAVRSCTMATFYMRRQLDLQRAARHLPYAVYNPQIIKHMSFVFRDLGVTALVHSSGAVVLTGHESSSMTEEARRQLANFLAHFVIPE